MERTHNQRCLLCNAEKTYLMTIEQKGYQKPNTFKIYYCHHCETSFSIPRIKDTNELYDFIYKNSKHIPGYCRYWEYAEKITSQKVPIAYLANREPIYWSAYQAIKQLASPSESDILEIGSGLGYFIYALRKAGYQKAIGCDISNEVVKRATDKFGNFYTCTDINNYAKSSDKKYDIIVLTEVIEHIEEPVKFLLAIASLLKNDGKIILTTPNKSFYPKESAWITDLPPIHCWWFSENSLKYIADVLQMNIRFIDFSAYYKSHPKYLFDKKQSFNFLSDSILDEKGKPIKRDIKRKGIPRWIKERAIYRIVHDIYPKLFRHYIVSTQRTHTQCAILTKRVVEVDPK